MRFKEEIHIFHRSSTEWWSFGEVRRRSDTKKILAYALDSYNTSVAGYITWYCLQQFQSRSFHAQWQLRCVSEWYYFQLSVISEQIMHILNFNNTDNMHYCKTNVIQVNSAVTIRNALIEYTQLFLLSANHNNNRFVVSKRYHMTAA